MMHGAGFSYPERKNEKKYDFSKFVLPRADSCAKLRVRCSSRVKKVWIV